MSDIEALLAEVDSQLNGKATPAPQRASAGAAPVEKKVSRAQWIVAGAGALAGLGFTAGAIWGLLSLQWVDAAKFALSAAVWVFVAASLFKALGAPPSTGATKGRVATFARGVLYRAGHVLAAVVTATAWVFLAFQ